MVLTLKDAAEIAVATMPAPESKTGCRLREWLFRRTDLLIAAARKLGQSEESTG